MGASHVPPGKHSDEVDISDNFKVAALFISSRDSVLRSLRDVDLQVAALRDLALVLILELRESPYRCSFHDCIRFAGHWIDFDGKHG